jgi:hypothetical protein
MITVTEEARRLFREIDNPDGTLLRLEVVAGQVASIHRESESNDSRKPRASGILDSRKLEFRR